MGAEAEELGVLDEPPAFGPQIPHDHAPHLVEEHLTGHAPEEAEGGFEPPDQGAHVLTPVEAQPQEPAEAQHHEQGVAAAPREAEVGEVDLGLHPGRRLEADLRLFGRPGPDRPDVLLELRVAARVARRPDLRQEPHGGQLRVGVQPFPKDPLVGIQLRGHGRTGPVADVLDVPVQLPAPHPPVDRLPAGLQLPSHLGHRQPLVQIVSQQHASLPSDHRRLPARGGGTNLKGRVRSRLCPLRPAYESDRAVTFSAATIVTFTTAADTRKPMQSHR